MRILENCLAAICILLCFAPLLMGEEDEEKDMKQRQELWEKLARKPDEDGKQYAKRLKYIAESEHARRQLLKLQIDAILGSKKLDNEDDRDLLLAAVRIALEHNFKECIEVMLRRISIGPRIKFDPHKHLPLEEIAPVVYALKEFGREAVIKALEYAALDDCPENDRSRVAHLVRLVEGKDMNDIVEDFISKSKDSANVRKNLAGKPLNREWWKDK